MLLAFHCWFVVAGSIMLSIDRIINVCHLHNCCQIHFSRIELDIHRTSILNLRWCRVLSCTLHEANTDYKPVVRILCINMLPFIGSVVETILNLGIPIRISYKITARNWHESLSYETWRSSEYVGSIGRMRHKQKLLITFNISLTQHMTNSKLIMTYLYRNERNPRDNQTEAIPICRSPLQNKSGKRAAYMTTKARTEKTIPNQSKTTCAWLRDNSYWTFYAGEIPI